MPAIPKPKKKKKRKKRRSTLDKKYICPRCGHDKLYNKTLADKRKILDHLCSDIVHKRDGEICQKCRDRKNEWLGLDPHHIFPKKGYPAGRWMTDNLVLLCKGCHNLAHNKSEEFRRWVFPWLCKRTSTPISQAEEMCDWLFSHVQGIPQFRACDFESKRKELEEK